MELTSCPRMLHCQPTGSTEIPTCNLCIQSPMCYPLGHHISTNTDDINVNMLNASGKRVFCFVDLQYVPSTACLYNIPLSGLSQCQNFKTLHGLTDATILQSEISISLEDQKVCLRHSVHVWHQWGTAGICVLSIL